MVASFSAPDCDDGVVRPAHSGSGSGTLDGEFSLAGFEGPTQHFPGIGN
jgi:hypothetical protein